MLDPNRIQTRYRQGRGSDPFEHSSQISMSDSKVAKGIVGIGCAGVLIYLTIYASVAAILLYFALYFVGVVERLPWQ